MAESKLTMAMSDFFAETGDYLGYGRGLDNGDIAWTDAQTRDITSQVNSALRTFYFSPQVDPRIPAHSWTFLRPAASVSLAAAASSAPLPDDFGGFEGPLTVQAASGSVGGYWPVDIVSEGQIDVRFALTPSASSRPMMAADRVLKGTSLTSSSRREIYVYPLADQAYTLRVQYYLLPDALTAQNPYAYGGAAHSETLKAGCRAAAERYLDNQEGVEHANYLRLLAGSIDYDRKHLPKTLGINTDRSDNFGRSYPGFPQGAWSYLGPITFNGQQP